MTKGKKYIGLKTLPLKALHSDATVFAYSMTVTLCPILNNFNAYEIPIIPKCKITILPPPTITTFSLFLLLLTLLIG